jgi:hypothetical protein
VQETVKGVMFAIDPGSTAALQIVGLAFGLINRSIENYNSRLILAVEPSTRNSVVLNALRRFRQQVKEQKLRFSSRPDAEYALREYMRRCLPFAIESEINDLSTLGSQGVSPERATTIFEAPVSMQIVPATQPLKPEQAFGTRPERPTEIKTDKRILQVFTGAAFSEADVRELQEIICLPPEGFAGIGSKLKLGISLFEATPWNAALRFPNKVRDGKISPKEWEGISNEEFCDRSVYRNYYEKQSFSRPEEVTLFIVLLNEKTPNEPLQGTHDLSSEALRDKIRQVRALIAPNEFGTGGSDQLTPSLVSKLQAG